MSEINSVIFIPDISGFTKFVNDTEIQHSQHIIEELLEVILNSNDMKLEVSEIEGDAVLFYRPGNSPSPAEVGKQTEKMFLNFHNYLRQIERDTICQCGACRYSSNLTLKFFLHYGEIGISQIRDHTKLMGKNVILAHRLMKNNIESHEYILMTQDYVESQNEKLLNQHLNWSEMKKGCTTYEHIGDVNYKYVELAPLRSQIKPKSAEIKATKYPNPIIVSTHISAPMNLIYNIVIDFSLRMEWTEGLKKITFDKEEIPRLGSKHICALPMGLVELETIQNSLSNDKIEHAEHATKNLLLPEATTFFILEKQKEGTLFTIEFHYKKRILIGWLIDLIIRKNMQGGFTKSCQNLKIYCEKEIEKYPVKAAETE